MNLNKHACLCVPILVKYPIQTTIPIGTTLKGKIMEVVSTNIDDVDKYSKFNSK
jgi:hypothetical protein